MSEPRLPIFILHYACAPIVGGVESIMTEHARVLTEHGHAVTLVAGRGAPGAHIPQLDSRDPAVLAVQAELDAGRVPAAFDALRADILAALRATLGANPTPPVVIAHNALTLHKNLALTAALADLAASGDARVIAWCHDLAWTNPLYLPALHDGYPWDLLRRPLPGVQYVVISEERRRELTRLFDWPVEAVRRVPNGIDPQRFLGASRELADAQERLDWFARDLILLAPVRMTRRKRLEAALAATAALKAAGRRPLLLITGPPGPHNPRQDYADFLVQERRRLGLEREVIFLSLEPWLPGGVSDELMAELYRWADALIFPSEQEGFGLPLLEAGLARLPIFCSGISVLREAGGADAHYFAPAAGGDEIAGLISRTLTAAGPAALRRRVFRDYNWESIYRTGLLPLIEAGA